MIVAADVDRALKALDIFALDPARRRNIAASLAQHGISAADVKRVFREAARTAGNPDIARGLFGQAIQDPARMREILADLETRRGLHREGSSIAYVTEDNPYGWAQPEYQRQMDTHTPAEWNGFRQCYNLSAEEAREAGTQDVRRHGCSRVEVMGEFDKARVKAGKGIAPDPFWNPAAVKAVLGAGKPGGDDPTERKLYGE